MSRDNVCTCLALYDWGGDLNAAQFHELAKDFFEATGVVPNVCCFPQRGHDSQRTSYSGLKDRLRVGPIPEEGLLLYHTLPDYAQLVFGWDVTAGMSFRQGKTMDFCSDHALRGLDLDYFEGLLDRIAERVKLCYGIGYLRAFNLGPSTYTYGMVTGLDFSDEEEAEADRITAWLHERMDTNRHVTGHLRDIYPLNVISQPHLSQRIERLPLADWIGRAPHRGSLRSLPGDASVWRIDVGNVDRVRQELIKTGLLIAYPPSSS